MGLALLLIAQLYRMEKQARPLASDAGFDCPESRECYRAATVRESVLWRFLPGF